MGWPQYNGDYYVNWNDFQQLLDTLTQVVSVSDGGAGGTATAGSAMFTAVLPDTVQLSGSYGTSGYVSRSDHRHALDQSIAPTWTSSHQWTNANLTPTNNYSGYLGTLNNKWLAISAAELWVETLVAANTMATIGGRILVGPTTELTTDLGSAVGDTTIATKHNNLAVNDNVYLEANGAVEFMLVTGGPTGAGPYSYTVTRDRDGTGRNAWPAGSAVFNTGTTGDGFIDLYSVAGINTASSLGPTIVGNVRTGTAYNAWAPRWAVGNLRNLYDYGTAADTYGFVAGDYTKTWVGIDDTNGFRIKYGSTAKVTIDTSGNASFSGSVTATAGTIGGFTLAANTLSSGTDADYVGMSSAGTNAFWAGDSTFADAKFSVTAAGVLKAISGTIGAWNIAATYLYTTTAGMATADYPFYAGDTYANRASAEFRVTTAGALTATSATITGAITATSGSIGSFTIGTYLYSGSKAAYNDGLAGVHIGSDGIGLGATFSVSAAGALTATSGTIGGFTISATDLYAGTGATRVEMQAAGGFWAGATARADAPFSVTPAGAMTATTATLSGTMSVGATGKILAGTATSGVEIDGTSGLNLYTTTTSVPLSGINLYHAGVLVGAIRSYFSSTLSTVNTLLEFNGMVGAPASNVTIGSRDSAGTYGAQLVLVGDAGGSTGSAAISGGASGSYKTFQVDGTGGTMFGNLSTYNVIFPGSVAGTWQTTCYYGSNGTVQYLMGGNVGIGTTGPTGIIDVQSSSASNVIAMFGAVASLNAEYPGYIYISDVSTLNSGYNVNSDSIGLWINYVGYLNGTTKFRDLTIGNGKGTAIAFFDGSTGNVGIGTAAPEALAHIKKADMGVTPALSTAPCLILEHDGFDGQLQFLCPSTKASYIRFGDENNYARGSIIYDHRSASESLILGVAATARLTVLASGTTLLDGGLHVGGTTDPSDNNLLVDGTGDFVSTCRAGGFIADADPGSGPAGCNVLTNGANVSVSSGVGSISMCGATNRGSSGFIKIYLAGTAMYIPVFQTITG